MTRGQTAHDKVEEVQSFKTTDGRYWPTMDEACDHQEWLDFRGWCTEEFGTDKVMVADMADKILAYWRVTPKSESLT